MKQCPNCGKNFTFVCFPCFQLTIEQRKKDLEKRDPIAAAIDREFQNLPRNVVEKYL